MYKADSVPDFLSFGKVRKLAIRCNAKIRQFGLAVAVRWFAAE